MHYIEVEKKFALADPAALKAKLEQLGAKSSEPTRQVDACYNAPHRGSSINFKRWHPVDALIKTHADEYGLPDIEVVFDHVVDAGDFVEFEFKSRRRHRRGRHRAATRAPTSRQSPSTIGQPTAPHHSRV